MIIYRLCRAPHDASSGDGAAKNGGRWNPPGIPAIYCSATASLAALEILVHYSVLPSDYYLTEINIPHHVQIEHVNNAMLPSGWDAITYKLNVQNFGARWADDLRSAVLSVPSSIVRMERNYIINPLHAQFRRIEFLSRTAFEFDPRLITA